MSNLAPGVREGAIARLAGDPWLAHEFIFKHRHREASSAAHVEVVRLMHGARARNLIQAFRGFGKSTLIEETIIIQALFGRFRNKLIVGASYERACERLASIKREFETNEVIDEFFGRMKGAHSTWQEGKITLKGGACVQALGKDQSLRGSKHHDWRPDSALVDDVEDKDEVRTPGGRAKTWDWFSKEFLPALDDPVLSKVDVIGTPMDPQSLIVQLEQDGWPTLKFPIEYLDRGGKRQATWEGKFPLWKVDEIKRDYRRDMTGFSQEYLLKPVADADRVFTADMIRVEPRQRGWQAVYAMFDPARTTNRRSATTGWAVWSWVNNRLVVWASGARRLQPDEIIDMIFTVAEHYDPVWIGVEEDGLNEFLMQPLRHEQAKRGRTIPVKGVRAPRGKLDFIRGLQPFFTAGEVVFATQLPELEGQLMGFPTGEIDAPNALAYALQMRPGLPLYEFSEGWIADDLEPGSGHPLFLAANATRGRTTAVLCQFYGGKLRVYGDWVADGEPHEVVAQIQAEAGLAGDAVARLASRGHDWREALKLPEHNVAMQRQPPRWVVPPAHGDYWNNVGLEQAIRTIPSKVVRGAQESIGRVRLRTLAQESAPAIAIDRRAIWTLRAFAGGYSRLTRGNGVADEAEPGVYRLLMEGLESFVGMTAALGDERPDDFVQPIAYNRHGLPYKSAMPQR